MGNVLVTISDKRLPVLNSSGNLSYYDADAVTATDYYPFGMQMPGRNYTSSSSSYRYGFNGKENDNEVKGEGNQQDYGMRIYDPRLGKFLSVDPLSKKFPFYSPFHFGGNNPLKNIDLDGCEPDDYTNNWIPRSLFEMKSGKGLGSYIIVNDPKLGVIDAEAIYDKWTKTTWFIHNDDQGNYYYLRNNNGNPTEMSIDPKTNTVSGGSFQLFATQNAIQAKLGAESARNLGLIVFGIATFGAAAPVMSAVGGASLIGSGSYAIPTSLETAGFAAAKGAASLGADVLSQLTTDPEKPVNWYSAGANFVGGALNINAFTTGAAASAISYNQEKKSFGLSAPGEFISNTVINGTLGSAVGSPKSPWHPNSFLKQKEKNLSTLLGGIPDYWSNAAGNVAGNAATDSNNEAKKE